MSIISPPNTNVQRVPFARMGTFSNLFSTYCTDYPSLSSYYSGDWRDPEERIRAADRAASFKRDRDLLVDVLLEQNARWGLDEATRAHIESLRRPETVAVVTGQQVGLFTGPLYTPYKTITALQLADQLRSETGRPVVPVFWLEGGDHDFEEVNNITVLRRNDLIRLCYTGHVAPDRGNLGPVGRIRLTQEIADVLDEVDTVLPSSDFHDGLMHQLRDAYRPGTKLLDAFARFMRALFPDSGLIFIDPDDARLKRSAAPLFRCELEDYSRSYAGLRDVSERLDQHFHAQVHPRPVNLFLLEAEGRFAIEPDDGDGAHFRVRGSDRRFNEDELLDLLEKEPERFSPNVVLRPIMQDMLLPTAAYVAGPSEVAYFAQFKPVYEWAGVPMPVIYPRASATLVESKVEKVLDRFDLQVHHFSGDLEQLFQQVVLKTMEVDIEDVFTSASRHLHEAVNELKPNVERVDRTLVRSAEATRATLLKELDKLKAKVVRAEKQQQEVVREQLEKAHVNLFPGGTLQERRLSSLYYLNKYGLTLLDRLRDDVSLDTREHQVITL